MKLNLNHASQPHSFFKLLGWLTASIMEAYLHISVKTK